MNLSIKIVEEAIDLLLLKPTLDAADTVAIHGCIENLDYQLRFVCNCNDKGLITPSEYDMLKITILQVKDKLKPLEAELGLI